MDNRASGFAGAGANHARPHAGAGAASLGPTAAMSADAPPGHRPRGLSVFEDLDFEIDSDLEEQMRRDNKEHQSGRSGRGSKKKKGKNKGGKDKRAGAGSAAFASMPIRGDPQYAAFHKNVQREQEALRQMARQARREQRR